MSTSAFSAHHFRRNLKAEVDRVVDNHEVLHVQRRNGGDFVVLISADDWRAIEETLHLNRAPGIAESILESANEPLEEGVLLADLEW